MVFHITKDIAGFLLLAAVSVVLGLLVNEARDHPLPLFAATTAQPAKIGLAEFQKIAQGGGGIVLDARSGPFYRAGHVPGAINLPRGDLESQEARLPSAKDRVIAVYCSGPDCDDSDVVAAALARRGYRRVSVFKGGWEAWTAAGLPAERSP